MKRRRGFPIPLILFGSDGSVLKLSLWEITRGELESYDAYAALITHNPDWASIAAQHASISTVSWEVFGYVDVHSDDASASGAIGAGYTQVDVSNSDVGGSLWFGERTSNPSEVFTHGAGYYNVDTNSFVEYNFIQGTWQSSSAASVFDVSGVSVVWIPGERSPSEVLDYFSSHTYDSGNTYFYFDTGLGEVRKITSYSLVAQTASYYNTTDNAFRKTEDGGTTWTATTIVDALLTNNPNAVFVSPDQANTSAQMRTYLDTGENYNANNTYYFYNNTEIREVSSFSASVAEVIKLTNFVLGSGVPSELSFDSAGVVSGTLPVTSRLKIVHFDVDIVGESTKVRIPVSLTAIVLSSSWSFAVGSPATLDLSSVLSTVGTNVSALTLSEDAPSEFSVSGTSIQSNTPVGYPTTLTALVARGRVDGEYFDIQIALSLSPAPTLPMPMPSSSLIGSGLITLSWDAVPGATGYRVYYRVSGGTHWIQIQRSDVASLTESFTPLINDTLYEFQVIAFGLGYQDSPPGEAFAAPAAPNTYQAWIANEKAWLVGDKVWTYGTIDIGNELTWKVGNETWIIGDETWLIAA